MDNKEENERKEIQLPQLPPEEAKQVIRLYQGKRVAPFFEEPIILDKFEVACTRVREAFESIIKYATFYLRRIEQRLGIKIEYAMSIRYNENFLPVLIIEVLGLYFIEDVKKARQQK